MPLRILRGTSHYTTEHQVATLDISLHHGTVCVVRISNGQPAFLYSIAGLRTCHKDNSHSYPQTTQATCTLDKLAVWTSHYI